MLVLSRKLSEEIVIGDDIVLKIIEIRGDKCRIGVQAPREMTVHRREVYDLIKAQNEGTTGDGAATGTN